MRQGRTVAQILTLNGSNDVFPPEDGPFRGLDDGWRKMGKICPKNSQKGGAWIDSFKPKRRILYISSISDHPLRKYDVISIFQDGSRSIPFRVCWCCCLQKAKVYQQTKFRLHISIHGWDITTSGLEKKTSAIFEFSQFPVSFSTMSP